MTAKRNYPLLFAKGLAMGAADVVPGVSGGTIAFISGIYEELVDSLRALNPAALTLLFREGPAAFWRKINGSFLLVLISGIIISVLSLAKLVVFCLEVYPLFIWSFFFGLILASIIYVAAQQRHWKIHQFVAMGVGMMIALGSAFSPPLAFTVTPASIFFSGMLAICAMILPGISGSFILLLLGMYPVILTALTVFDLAVLVSFGCGAIVGLMVFSHILSWLLHHHRATTLSLLIGFLLGSLAVVWPWKVDIPLVDGVDSHSVGRELFMPWVYQGQVGNAHIALCLLFMAVGFFLVLGLEYLGSYIERNKSQR